MTVLFIEKSEDIPSAPIDGKPTLVYWNISCFGLPIRLALVCAGVDFVDVRMEAGPWDHGKGKYKKEWYEAKKSNRMKEALSFPNLPYFLDGNVAMTQSEAILRHVGRTYQLMGDRNKEYELDMLLEEIREPHSSFIYTSASPGADAVKKWYSDKVPVFIKSMERYLSDRPFLMGESPTIADIQYYVFLDRMKMVQEDLFNNSTECYQFSESTNQFIARFEALPRIKQYMSSEDYKRKPVNNPQSAVFG